MPRTQNNSHSQKHDSREFKIYINEGEKKQIMDWVSKKPRIETGGDLFGLWRDRSTAVVQLVIGPGKHCKRTQVSFFQDIGYLGKIGAQIINEQGLSNIGQWHSHHQLSLNVPSAGDENTVWGNMPSLGLERYIVCIANIKDAKVSVNCFLFEIENGKRLPVLHGTFCDLQGNSPLRSNKRIQNIVKYGAESINEICQDYNSKNQETAQATKNGTTTSDSKLSQLNSVKDTEKRKEQNKNLTKNNPVPPQQRNQATAAKPSASSNDHGKNQTTTKPATSAILVHPRSHVGHDLPSNTSPSKQGQGGTFTSMNNKHVNRDEHTDKPTPVITPITKGANNKEETSCDLKDGSSHREKLAATCGQDGSYIFQVDTKQNNCQSHEADTTDTYKKKDDQEVTPRPDTPSGTIDPGRKVDESQEKRQSTYDNVSESPEPNNSNEVIEQDIKEKDEEKNISDEKDQEKNDTPKCCKNCTIL